MSLRPYIALCGIVCLILVSISLGAGLKYLHTRYMDIFHINYLWENNKCVAVDDDGKEYVTEDGTLFGTNFGIAQLGEDNYGLPYCAFNPLMLTDKEFKESALTLYGMGKLFSSFSKFFNGDWKLPDKNLIKEDVVLSNMILNPWYTSDDVFFTPVIVEYTTDLSVFKIDDKRFTALGNDGLYLSWYNKFTNYNEDEMRVCTSGEVAKCNKSPADCNCKLKNVDLYYLYTDNANIIELPMRLYLGQLDDAQTKTIEIKVGGKKMQKVVQPLRVKTVADLENVLTKNFYEFKAKIKTDCDKLAEGQQKLYDSKCKFFNAGALSGIVTAFRRIVIANIPEDVSKAYIEKIEKKNSKNQKLNYLEFFMWLAAKSQIEQITYEFKPFADVSRASAPKVQVAIPRAT